MMGFGLIFAIFTYLAVVGVIFAFQRRLMYFPVKTIPDPSTLGLSGIEEFFIESADGTKLQVWTRAAKRGYPTIIYFHGNAFHLGERAVKFGGFISAGFGLIAPSYRGFGKSEGRPSEKGIYDDARAAVDYATQHLNIPIQKIIYFGESLGSGVAVQMAYERPPALVTLEAAYTSVETRSAELYPYVLGVRRLVRDKYNSLAKINNIRAPLLMLHGERDVTIPLRHGKALFDAALEPKHMVVYPDVHHADYTNEQILTPLLEVSLKYHLIDAPLPPTATKAG